MVQALETQPLTPSYGVKVTGVDLEHEINPDRADEFRHLFTLHHLLFFPEQNVSTEAQLRFASIFGDPVDQHHDGTFTQVISTDPEQDQSYIRLQQNGRFRTDEDLDKAKQEGGTAGTGKLFFHSDWTYLRNPLSAICLFALDASVNPSRTTFCSNVLGFAGLPADYRQRIRKMESVHMANYSSPTSTNAGRVRQWELESEDLAKYPSTQHPLVLKHPVSGDEYVFISEQFASHIVGVSPEESEEIIQRIFASLYREENIYEHPWATGDLVIWNNLAMQHGRRATTEMSNRTLRRVVLAGSV